MIIQVDERIAVEVYFDPYDREEGFEDEIRFCIHESAPENLRLFATDHTSFLLTIDQLRNHV